ncbi:MAG: hypothetical protein Sv326_0651 [Candidatus Fermentimicrarchaeum limneticum]|uniref:Antitoxin SocA-like Panacea domain-containing protein n=1 Tax=Fermentimicrarchaeum limneticum TaxID=2795018 RepID=A0A7D5XLK1_FERL1|nr:MAG: hypothetical protein Sv326_0651 [Candidatus Fermentimicrarchaeum limneticum]
MVGVNLSKAEQVYLHIIKNLQDRPNFGKTLFYKVLYFSDFDYYERFEKSITGDKYRRITHGPAPCTFDIIIKRLKEKDMIRELHFHYGMGTQIRYCYHGDDKTDKLAKEEIKEIDRNIQRLSGMTASQASAYSHQDMPCKVTKLDEIIDYDLVHYRNPIFSVSD